MKPQEIEKSKDYKYGFTTDIENVRAPKGLNKEVLNSYLELRKNQNGC